MILLSSFLKTHLSTLKGRNILLLVWLLNTLDSAKKSNDYSCRLDSLSMLLGRQRGNQMGQSEKLAWDAGAVKLG